MTFKHLQLNTEYRSGKNNAIKEFFTPLLSGAILYKRAVGFFSSTALVQISRGIAKLVQNGGRIQLIVSPRLSEEDIIAIEKGYAARESIIDTAIMREFHEPKTLFEEERLNMLATLIADNRLDIKIAFPDNLRNIGMYHEKMGLIYDAENNIVAFSGSTNETESAFIHNYEVLDVFCSWQSEFEQKKVFEKELAFHRLWTNADEAIKTFDFPDVAIEKLKTYKRDSINYNVDESDNEIGWGSEFSARPKNAFRLPENLELYAYQNKAIEKWEERGFSGIFDMATGSGKTYTALGALSELSKKLNDHLGVFIVCPYQHLVEQWVEDIRVFNVEPLICYSKYDWDKKLKLLLEDFKLGVKERYCVIACNASFSLLKMQEQVKYLSGNICLVVDEAHNFGAEGLQKCLLPNFKYRLALSATIERHRDASGTKALFDYFGEKCIEFTLKEAIEEGFLTPYKYYPILVTLDSEELMQYIDLTEKIIKIIRFSKKDDKLPKQAEMLLIKRARIVAGAKRKIAALKEAISNYKSENNILVYCGATRVNFEEDDVSEDLRQIEIVTSMLGNDLGMRVSMFTSKEKANERSMIKNSFAEGISLQALIAIKCLDEGVNIPGIRTAFILASSTNPKEYIQRRGRVLRKARNKDFAEIFDFIVMPHDIRTNEVEVVDLNAELSLVKRELERVADFRELCENPSDSFELLEQINEYYRLNYIGGKDYGI